MSLFPRLIQRLREGIDPNDIPETEAVMDAAADELEWCSAQLESMGRSVDNLKKHMESLTSPDSKGAA